MLKRTLLGLGGHETVLALIVLAVIAAATARFPQFASPAVARDILNDTALLLILALGQLLVLMTRAVDLSVAANVALSGMGAALLNKAHPELGVVPCVFLAVSAGALLGAINGVLVWRAAIPPIVATLGAMAIFRGLTFFVSGGGWVNSSEMSGDFLHLQRADLLGLSFTIWISAGAFGAVAFALRYTKLGRACRAAGANPAAAIYVGIDPGRAQFWAYLICGAMAGLVGYLWVSRFGVAYTDTASGFELQVIAACVVGGVAITGGVGSALGVLLGALLLGVMRNALPLAGVSPFWQMAASGAVIVVASLAKTLSARAPRKRILERA